LVWADTYFGTGTVDDILCHIRAIESKARILFFLKKKPFVFEEKTMIMCDF
jgi:hypothetical protein